jgi:hypothetical protein
MLRGRRSLVELCFSQIAAQACAHTCGSRRVAVRAHGQTISACHPGTMSTQCALSAASRRHSAKGAAPASERELFQGFDAMFREKAYVGSLAEFPGLSHTHLKDLAQTR